MGALESIKSAVQAIGADVKSLTTTKQDKLAYDTTPTQSSSNSVTSGSIWAALNTYNVYGSPAHKTFATGTPSTTTSTLYTWTGVGGMLNDAGGTASNALTCTCSTTAFTSPTAITGFYSSAGGQLQFTVTSANAVAANSLHSALKLSTPSMWGNYIEQKVYFRIGSTGPFHALFTDFGVAGFATDTTKSLHTAITAGQTLTFYVAWRRGPVLNQTTP